MMSTTFEVGDVLPRLRHTATPLQLFRYSAVTWNPHRIHFDERYARGGPRRCRAALPPAAALALRCVTEGLGPEWQVANVAYRLRKPVYAPVELAYTARVTAVEDDGMTLELIEEQPSGEIGFEGTVRVSRTQRRAARGDGGSEHMRSGTDPHRELLRLLRRRASAMADLARAGGIDVLTGDYLAEVTMLILGKARAKDPTKGYATTFLQHLDAALDTSWRTGSGSSSMPADSTRRAGRRDRALIARHGHDLRVSHIEGDDVSGRLDALQQVGDSLRHLTSGEPLSSWPHQPLTANAYLGGFGIARPRARCRHRHHRPRRRRGRWSPRRLVVGPNDTTPSPARSPPGTSSNAGHRRPAATSPFRSIADLVEPGFRSPRSPPTARR